MINVKKCLAGLMTAAMVFTSAGASPVAVFAQDTAPAAIAQTTDATVTITSSTGTTYEYSTDKDDFETIIKYAKPGDTVVVKGTVVLSKNIVISNDLTSDGKVITLDLTDATILATAANSYAIIPDTGISEYKKSEGVWAYSAIVYSPDNLVIDFPAAYSPTPSNKYGVKATYTMASGETVDLRPSDTLTVTTEGSTDPTCTEAGTAKLQAVVKDGSNVTLATATKDYGEVEALGHNYGVVKDGKINLSQYKGSQAATDAVQITWAIRGNSGNGNINVSKDADGNTIIESIQAKCLNETSHGTGTNAPAYEDVKSWTIKEAKAGAAASSGSAGSTIYTIEIVTADDVLITVVQTVYDVPALDATNVGLIQKFGFETYIYTKDGDNYVLKSGNASYEDTIYPDYTQVGNDYYKTVIAEDASINYQITYKDALNTNKTGTVNGTLKSADIDGSHKTAFNTCGMNTYYYKPVQIIAVSNASNMSTNIVTLGASSAYGNVSATNTVTSTDLATQKTDFGATAGNNFKVQIPETAVTHTVDMNNGEYQVVTDPTTFSEGKATITCKHCGNSVSAVIPMLTTGVTYEKTDGTLTAADDIQDAQANGVYVLAPTCEKDGYSFYWSANAKGTVNAAYPNGGTDEYKDAAGKYHKYPGSEAKIAGTDKKALGHDWYIAKPAAAVWNGTSSCAVTYTCKNANHAEKTITYYPGNGVDSDSEKYNAITKETVEGKDCSEKNTFVYTVTGLTDILGNKVQTSEKATTFGPHDYEDQLNWSTDGKKATVTRTCKNKKCGEGRNTNPLVVTATVTSAVQEDGSVLYTATYDGEELGTKKVFDLSDTKAVKAVVNGGEPVDENVYPGNGSFNVKNLPTYVITMNGVELSKDLYTFVAGSYTEYADNTATFTIAAAEDTDAIGEFTVRYNILNYNQFEEVNVRSDIEVDGDTPVVSTYDNNRIQITFDETPHVLEVTDVYDITGNPVKKATVKYSVVVGSATAVKDPAALEYGDSAEFTEVGVYQIYAQITADKFTPFVGKIAEVRVRPISKKAIEVFLDNATVIEGDKPNLHIRAVSIDNDDYGKELAIDPTDFTVTTLGGEPLENLKAGVYKLVVTSDVYDVEMPQAGYMAELTVLAKDSSSAEDQAKAEAVVGMINALNENSSPADVAAARAAYDALTDTQKKRVDSEVVKKLDTVEAAVTAKVVDALKAVTDDTPADVAAKAVNDYNALSPAQKAVVQKDTAAVAGLTKASTISGVEIAGKEASSIKITNKAKVKVKRKKSIKITYKKTGNGKVTFTNKSAKAVKKVITVKGNKITVTKKAKKGKTYKVKIQANIAGTATYKPAKSAVKVIKIKVK